MKGLTRLTTDGSSDGSIDSASRATMPSAYVRTFFDGYAPYYEQLNIYIIFSVAKYLH